MDYSLEDLIDIRLLQNLQEKLNVIFPFPTAIIDNNGKVLTAVAWQDICKKFHRTNPKCEKECISSDKYIIDKLSETNSIVSYQCPHGLFNNATPIIIDGKHLGNFFTGQFLFEKPDLNFFRKQAEKYGFDENAYLEALEKVSICTKEEIDPYFEVIKGIIEIIADLGLKNLKEFEISEAIFPRKTGKTALNLTNVRDITYRKKVEEEIKQMHIFRETLLKTIPYGMDIVDETGTILFQSDNLKEIFGESAIGKKCWALYRDDKKQCSDCPLVEGITLGETKTYLSYGVMGNRIFEISHTGMMYDGKKAMLEIFLDITDKKKKEEALKISEAKHSSMISNISDVIGIISADGIIKYKSPNIEKWFGWQPQDLVGTYGWPTVHPDDLERIQKEFCTLIQKNDSTKTVEYRYLCKDGSYKPIELTAKNLISDPLIEGVLMNYHDITNRKKLEDGLIHSHNLHQYIIEHNFSAVAVHDKDLKYIFVSKRYLNDYNIGESDIIGRHLYHVFPDLPQKWKDVHQKALAGEISSAEDDTWVRDDGSVIWTRWECRPWYDHDGLIGGFIIYTEVITKQKEAEIELIKAKERAEECDRLKSAFLSNMSHEIRTPMNGILGFTELLKEPNLTGEKQLTYIEIIEKSGERMLNTINNIVEMSKIESGMMQINIKEMNINEQILFVYNFFKPEANSKGLQLFFMNGLPSEEASIKTDHEKVYDVLVNLIKNAIKYSDEGSITFGYNLREVQDSTDTQHAKYLEFFVKDNGIGIPKERQKLIFERFIQGDLNDKRTFQGSGLGLSICKSYIELLDGKIWIESKEGTGSIFYFTIPYNSGSTIKNTNNSFITKNIKEVQIKKLKILIAEDDMESSELLRLRLEKLSKDILYAKNGIEAVEICRNNPDIDLILMDIQMPILNGHEATRQIRQFNKNVIIIAQTAYGYSTDKEKAIDSGCNDYISKPINYSLLFEFIKTLFDKKI